jgi:hypothetical protein
MWTVLAWIEIKRLYEYGNENIVSKNLKGRYLLGYLCVGGRIH